MKIKEVQLINFGSIVTSIEEKEFNTNSLTGYFLHCDKIKFIEKSDKFQGLKGLKFGIEYFVKGYTDSENEDANFYCKILHPKFINPETQEQFFETVELKDNYLNKINFDYFFFEYDWEVVKGVYTFQIVEDERILLEKSFEIY